MKKAGVLLSTAVSMSILFSASLVMAAQPTQSAAAYTQQDLNEQDVMGLLWVQTSAEYRELCYQAYNAATMEVDKAVKNAKKGDKPLAIVLDCDETVLDNSASQGGYINHNDAYSSKNWNKWMAAAKATAMPGATEYLQGVAAKGVEIFYVTNRDAKTGFEGTIKNLKELKFPYVDAKHVLLKTDDSNKQGRFDAVANKYNVVVYMGDNAGDLPIGTYHKSMKDRNNIVDQYKDKFGTKFIVLPNPEYGDWESSLDPNYWSLSAQEKSDLRKSLIKKWRADQN
ncbi:MAG: 5'-nucleotidase, lipoprotein e(P4) family [Selenomonadaceae bacterium]